MKGKYTWQINVIKKVMCLVIVITMLAGDFIWPIKLWSIAKDSSEIEGSTIAQEDENASANVEAERIK